MSLAGGMYSPFIQSIYYCLLFGNGHHFHLLFVGNGRHPQKHILEYNNIEMVVRAVLYLPKSWGVRAETHFDLYW